MIADRARSDPPQPAETTSEQLELRVRFEHLTNRDGLSQMTVFSIVQDRRGFLWFGTEDGLNRYDGHEFRIFEPRPFDPSSLTSGPILALEEDRAGSLWIGTQGGGLDRFDPETERFVHYRHDPENPKSLSNDVVRALLEDGDGDLWIGTEGGLDRFDPATEELVHFRLAPGPRGPDASPLLVSALALDRQGALWVGTRAAGLWRLDTRNGSSVQYLHQPSQADSLGSNEVNVVFEDGSGRLWVGSSTGLDRYDASRGAFIRFDQLSDDATAAGLGAVWSVAEDSRGELWVSTMGNGIRRFDPDSGRMIAYRHDPDDPHSLAQDGIWKIMVDRAGALWLGTNGRGVDRADPAAGHFAHFHHDPQDSDSLGGNQVWALEEDRAGDLWIGTWGAGVDRLDRATGRLVHYRHDPEDPESLSSDQVFAIHRDRAGHLWIGTWKGGLERFDPTTGGFLHHRHDPADPDSLGGDQVWAIHGDREGYLWLGLRGRGLDRFDPSTGRFVHFRHDPTDPTSLGSDRVRRIDEDHKGRLWLSLAGAGLDRLDPETGQIVHFRHDPTDSQSLSSDFVQSVHQDTSGHLWVATADGLDRWIPEKNGFEHLRQEDGLADDLVYDILEDRLGRLWLSSNAGLTRFDPASGMAVYRATDGLQDDEFNAGAAALGADGTLYFGGVNGFNAFRPERFRISSRAPAVVLTGLRIFERDHEQPMTGLERVVLGPRDNFFSFEYAALDFSRRGESRYAYLLEGYDDDWVDAGARRHASYTRVPPGEYLFRVKGSSRDGVWNEEGASLAVHVLAPWWRSGWAYGLYLLGALFLVVTHLGRQRREVERQRSEAERERAVSRQLREVDRLRDEFLANTSHELRTPLFGIIGLAESLIDGAAGELPAIASHQLSLLAASGRRLSRLVDDILDFSKLRRGGLELELRPLDLHAVVGVVLTLSRPLIGEKELVLKNSVPTSLPAARADENRVLQILHNLVGNAIRFTESGTVEVAARHDGDALVVTVADTGIGIAAEDQQRIFEAFEQVPGAGVHASGGTGLGLSVSRRLVELHGGRLWLESTPGEGATFSFSLPRCPGEAEPRGTDGATRSDAEVQGFALAAAPTAVPATDLDQGTAPKILVVDDELVNRQVLSNHLANRGFDVTTVASGPRALELCEEQSFDLVVLDLMMPRMSGFEVCRELREHHGPEELPVVFLTARRQEGDLVDGLAAGGNDYLVKPIGKGELLARVQVHLDISALHRRLAGRYEELSQLNYAIAHDLKNPLTTIANYLGRARQDAKRADGESLEHDLDRLEAAALILRRQLDELFELSRIGVEPNSLQEVDLDALVREVVEEVEGAWTEPGPEIEVSPLPTVECDRQRIREVLRRLLDNAATHMGAQPAPRIELGVERSSADPGAVGEEIFFVRDNGIGIDPRYHEKVFGLFERLDPQASEGSGVGLTLVRRIIEAHGGRVWVESVGRGQGCKVCFTLQ